MSWLLKGILCLTTMLGFNLAAQAATEAMGRTHATLKVKALLFDYVRLPEKMQKQMQDQVSEIYRKAGVEMEWAPCSTGEGQAERYPGCTGYEDATHVLLRIHPHVRKGMTSEAAGEAIVSARIINVYWDRVQYEAVSLRVPALEVLAHIIAHEIGHLLLGPNSHAPAGIMAARWRSRDLIHIFQGGLSFTPRECELIQAVRKRQDERGLSSPVSIPTDVPPKKE